MTCEDVLPFTTLAPNAGFNQIIEIGGYDWIAVLTFTTGAGAAGLIGVVPDSANSGFVVGAWTSVANESRAMCFGGGGGVQGISGAAGEGKSAVPFVPNRINIILSATVGNTWTYAIIGGYNQ